MSERIPAEWLYILVKLTSPMEPEKAAERLKELIPALNMIAPHKLTDESAVFVASKCKRSPNFGTICELVDAWWEENRPKVIIKALPAPDEGWQAKQLAVAEQCRKDWSQPGVVREAIAKVRGHPMEVALGRMLATTVSVHGKENLGLIPPEWMPRG